MSRRQRGAGEVMKEETIFHLALDKPPAERAAFLEETCAGDAALCRRVQVLLQEHENPRSLLEPPAAGLESNLTLDAPTAPLPPGTVIGRYKILEPIGEGGYGTVFMAEQTSPVRRKVALKIIKAGMDTRQVIARFEAERQALALMDHPNIAKVFDAGVTDAGRPYFVMELVKGTSITKYCDEHRLAPRARLALFVQVCHAVQHAHQKGIIHRDLKPTNVLVAQYDGKPVPKVIDFGVAKATGQRLTDATMFTGFGDVIGTPQYMSPEQAELNQLDVDTRSDIYSLGVLLYELLTGTTPLEGKRVREVALLEILRVIREEEPPRPSTRLTSTAELASVAAQRGVEPKKLSGIVRGELDWIVMRALEKDRSRRYETANGLAMDVQRYLNDEAVHACPPSRRYRATKIIRRHCLAIGAAGTIALTLAGGVIVSSWQAMRATRAERVALTERDATEQARRDALASARQARDQEGKARTEAKKSEVVARFLEQMLSSVNHSVAMGRDTTLMRDILDQAADRVDKDLADQPEVQAQLLRTIGNTYFEIGESARALKAYEQGLAIYQKLYGHEHPRTAAVIQNIALVQRRRGQFAEAEQNLGEAL